LVFTSRVGVGVRYQHWEQFVVTLSKANPKEDAVELQSLVNPTWFIGRLDSWSEFRMATTRKRASFALQVSIPTLRTDVDASGIAFSQNLPGPAFALASHTSLALLLVSVSPVRCFAIFSRSVCWGWHDVLYAPHPIVTAPQPRYVIGIVS
jgi:hypothetical protein